MTESGAGRLLRTSSVPLWRQLSDHLRQQIQAGVLRPGARMPTEIEMGASFGVSRITVRAAIERLLSEQLVIRAQGKGTFVAGAVVRQELSDLAGIIPNLEAQGIAFETQLVVCEQAAPPPAVAASLGIEHDPVLHFRRLYERAGKPLGLCETWIPDADGITREQVAGTPCYMILSHYLDRPVGRAKLTIKVRRPERSLASLLGVGRNEALLCLERASFNAAERVCEHTHFWVRPDQYEFGIDLDRPMPIATGIKQSR
ncbi:GntR family transcriptional regulator [Methylobacterium sp. SD21]|uniref:GntR family transcriptional regulator n=1 Tax=Methylobacterium litchii TaxID=3138810 RepID=UPI00313B2416